MFKSILLASALLLPACTAATTPTIAQEAHEQPAILSLSATGQVQVEPDMATVSAGAVSRAETASQALAENAALPKMIAKHPICRSIRSMKQSGAAMMMAIAGRSLPGMKRETP